MSTKNLANLRALVGAYHSAAVGDFTSNGIDLFLFSVNNALKEAQMLHDFEDCRCTALLDINATTGGDLADATIEQGGSTITVTAVGGTPAGTFTRQGVYNGYDFYMQAGAVAFFLYFHSTYHSYIISTSVYTGVVPSSVRWIPAAAQTMVDGDYIYANDGTTITTLTLASNGTFAAIREVLAVTRQRPDGTYIPLDFARADIPIERDRTELEFSDNLFPYLRYPSDAQINARGTNSSIIQRGSNLSIYPRYTQGVTTPFNVRLECFAWLQELIADNYADSSPSNFFLDYGFSWLQWYTIVETNHLFKSFTTRTEGNLAPPEKARDEAWAKLTQFDSYRVDSNTTRSR